MSKKQNSAAGGINETVIPKGPLYRALLLILYTALCIVGGVLFLVCKPIPQSLATAICLFATAIVPAFFCVDFFAFRMTLVGTKIRIRKLASAESEYAYTDVSWALQNRKKDRGAVLVFVKGKQTAKILPYAPNYEAITTLRHRGAFSDGETAMLRRIADKADKK